VNLLVGLIVALVGSIVALVGYIMGAFGIVIALLCLVSPFVLLIYILNCYLDRHSKKSHANDLLYEKCQLQAGARSLIFGDSQRSRGRTGI
jgi:hypothetical protein